MINKVDLLSKIKDCISYVGFLTDELKEVLLDYLSDASSFTHIDFEILNCIDSLDNDYLLELIDRKIVKRLPYPFKYKLLTLVEDPSPYFFSTLYRGFSSYYDEYSFYVRKAILDYNFYCRIGNYLTNKWQSLKYLNLFLHDSNNNKYNLIFPLIVYLGHLDNPSSVILECSYFSENNITAFDRILELLAVNYYNIDNLSNYLNENAKLVAKEKFFNVFMKFFEICKVQYYNDKRNLHSYILRIGEWFYVASDSVEWLECYINSVREVLDQKHIDTIVKTIFERLPIKNRQNIMKIFDIPSSMLLDVFDN